MANFTRIIRTIFRGSVDLAPDRLSLCLDLSPIMVEPDMTVRHILPKCIRRRGVETKLVLEGSGVTAAPDPALIKAVARAHSWFDDLVSGRALSLGEIANNEGISGRYVGRLIPLAFLSPYIVEAILAGSQPVELTVETLTKHTELPVGLPPRTMPKLKLDFGLEGRWSAPLNRIQFES